MEERPAKLEDVPEYSLTLKVSEAAVVGTGIMGSGIALALAVGGLDVRIWDIKKDALESGLARARSALKTLVDFHSLTKKEADAALGRIQAQDRLVQVVQGTQLVVEAVPENIAVKRKIFGRLDYLCEDETILTSNTSTFKIESLASATSRPDRVVGTHWMNPPYLLRPVEVIPSAATSKRTLDAVTRLLESIGKRPILCKDTPGFLVNRMHSALLVEAISIVERGIASPTDVDAAWTKFLGPRYCVMGPFQLMDSFGLDTEYSQYSYLHETLNDSKFRPPTLLKKKVESKQLGLKTGKGFYDYSGRRPQSIVEERDRQLMRILQFLGL